jgi:hypothetical protein
MTPPKATGAMRIRRALIAAAAVLTLACLATVAQADETVNAKLAFVPYRLGASTTIVSNIEVLASNGEVPSPAVKIELHFPQSLSFTSSNLGLAICDPEVLLLKGEEGCSPNSRLGLGEARVAVPFGPEIVREGAQITVYMGPSVTEGVTLLLYGESRSPVYAQMLLEGSLVAGDGPFNELLLKSDVPLIPTLPGAKDVAITNMHLSLGPRDLKYYERVHGHTVSYHPRGLVLPVACPAGGFPFTSTITFQDGSVSNVNIVVPCRHHRHRASSATED